MVKFSWLNRKEHVFFGGGEISSITARTPQPVLPHLLFHPIFSEFLLKRTFLFWKNSAWWKICPWWGQHFPPLSTVLHTLGHHHPLWTVHSRLHPWFYGVAARVDASTLAMGRMTLGASNREGDKWLIPLVVSLKWTWTFVTHRSRGLEGEPTLHTGNGWITI